MLAWAFFFESLMAATMILAFSEGMPWTSLIFWRTLELAAGSSFSNSRFLRETPRLTSFWERISMTALSLYSSCEASWMASVPSSSILDLESFRSKRA
jgi:hypothetical protein